MLVQTTLGLLDKDSLFVKDVVEMQDNARITATEWYADGVLVRRDVNVNILRGVALDNQQENI